jgi:hypothetical protein
MLFEDYSREQFFWDGPTLDRLVGFCSGWSRIGGICCPMLESRMQGEGPDIHTFDIDERFSDLPGFIRWDLTRPQTGFGGYELLICDPPFEKISLETIFSSLQTLASGFQQSLLIAYPLHRVEEVETVFAPWNVRLTSIQVRYLSVDGNPVVWYSNLPQAELQALEA